MKLPDILHKSCFASLQNPVHPVLLEDHCGILLLLRYLAEFGRMVRLQNPFLPTLQNRLHKEI